MPKWKAHSRWGVFVQPSSQAEQGSTACRVTLKLGYLTLTCCVCFFLFCISGSSVFHITKLVLGAGTKVQSNHGPLRLPEINLHDRY